MSQHIVLTFLSDIKTKEVSCGYEAVQTKYTNVEGEMTRSTNESALRYLLQNLSGEHLARIFAFASNAVRNPENSFPAVELNGKQVTHLEYFRERMRKFIPYVDDCMPEEAVYPYDEAATVEKSLESVAKMAKRIQDFMKSLSGEKVILHVDLTGGMRSVNMMMLDVVRLLEYSGVEIGHLLYSKYDRSTKCGTVEELGNIYALFQLISGAEEFVRFGSAKVLGEFFSGRTQSDQLQCLLEAMEQFAEEIKLCHYGQLRESIIKLHDAVRDFDSGSGSDVQELLLGRLISRIRKEYEELIELRDLDDLRVIRWCVRNGYMQQALTLYTERIPEYMGEHGLICQKQEEAAKLNQLVAVDSMGRNRWFYLLNECRPRTDRINKYREKFCSLIKTDAIGAIVGKKFDLDSWYQKLEKLFEESSLSLCGAENRLKNQVRVLMAVSADPSMLLNLDSEELAPLRPIFDVLQSELSGMEKGYLRKKRIFEFLQKELKNEDMRKFFPMPSFSDSLIKQYPHAARTHEMIMDGIFQPAVDENLFLSMMEKYVRLKDERNHSNHARHDQGEFASAEELRSCIEEGLDEMEHAVQSLRKSEA